VVVAGGEGGEGGEEYRGGERGEGAAAAEGEDSGERVGGVRKTFGLLAQLVAAQKKPGGGGQLLFAPRVCALEYRQTGGGKEVL